MMTESEVQAALMSLAVLERLLAGDAVAQVALDVLRGRIHVRRTTHIDEDSNITIGLSSLSLTGKAEVKNGAR